MKFLILSSLFGCIAGLPATDDPIPAPSIGEAVQYSGKGCPQGTVSATVQPDLSGTPGSYHLIADLTNITVLGTPGSSVTKVTKDCLLAVNVQLPGEWQFSVNADGTDVSGYMRLFEKSMKGSVIMQYDISNFDGPV